METVGLIGLGKIGLPIAENLIKSGYRVLGYRRGSMAEFERLGGVAARSPTDIGAQADIVLTCLPSAEALDEVVTGKQGLVYSARPDKSSSNSARIWFPTRSARSRRWPPRVRSSSTAKSAARPAWSRARKAVVYLAGDEQAAKKAEPVMRGFTDVYHYFGPFGSASKVKLINNLLVAVHIAATAEAMALGVKAGVDTEMMIKAVAAGSGGSAQFGIRAPWMAQRRFLPAHGNVPGLSHYFELVGDLADRAGVATPMFDRAIELYQLCSKMGLGELDHAVHGRRDCRDAARKRAKKKAKTAAKKKKAKIQTKKTKKKTKKSKTRGRKS